MYLCMHLMYMKEFQHFLPNMWSKLLHVKFIKQTVIKIQSTCQAACKQKAKQSIAQSYTHTHTHTCMHTHKNTQLTSGMFLLGLYYCRRRNLNLHVYITLQFYISCVPDCKAILPRRSNMCIFLLQWWYKLSYHINKYLIQDNTQGTYVIRGTNLNVTAAQVYLWRLKCRC